VLYVTRVLTPAYTMSNEPTYEEYVDRYVTTMPCIF